MTVLGTPDLGRRDTVLGAASTGVIRGFSWFRFILGSSGILKVFGFTVSHSILFITISITITIRLHTR